jgi:hypothetical protein
MLAAHGRLSSAGQPAVFCLKKKHSGRSGLDLSLPPVTSESIFVSFIFYSNDYLLFLIFFAKKVEK